jgi:hypothetical protein
MLNPPRGVYRESGLAKNASTSDAVFEPLVLMSAGFEYVGKQRPSRLVFPWRGVHLMPFNIRL